MSRSHPISRSTDLYRDIEVYSHHHLSRRRNSLRQLPLFYHDEHLGIGHLLFYRKSSQRGRRRDCRMDSQTDHLRGGHMQTFNCNLKKLGVVESKRNAIRRGFVHELLNAQTRSCVHILPKERVRKLTVAVKRASTRWTKSSKDWTDLNENWWKAVGRNMDRRTMCGKCKRAS